YAVWPALPYSQFTALFLCTAPPPTTVNSLSLHDALPILFAAVFAVAGPVLLTITSKVGRKKLMLITMAIFVGANVMTYFSARYMMIMVARVITSAAAALIVVLAITIAGKIALPHQRAKSIGLVFMGVSSALVLGVPI